MMGQKQMPCEGGQADRIDAPGGAEELGKAPERLDVAPEYGERVRLQGLYEVDPIAGGKRFQGAWLVLDDGTRYVIAYRPVPEHFRFQEKRVIVTGRPYKPGQDTQHIRALHLVVESIELAPGEVPYASPPTTVLPPPQARTGGEVAARTGRWVRVKGVLVSVRDAPDGYLGIAELQLDDGVRVRAGNIRIAEWSPYVGQRVIVIARAARPLSGEKGSYELVGWSAVCAAAANEADAAADEADAAADEADRQGVV